MIYEIIFRKPLFSKKAINEDIIDAINMDKNRIITISEAILIPAIITIEVDIKKK
jgi:hypothetical protein